VKRAALSVGACILGAAVSGTLRPLVCVLELRAWTREHPGTVNGAVAQAAVEACIAQDRGPAAI
jgi:hypothetical protein